LPYDCNQNQKPDGCDIADGTLTDIDGDGVPENCGTCASDLNHDGSVTGADLGRLLGDWGTNSASDINRDGVVNGADLGILLGDWGACN
jgi:hypothetical protein